MTADAQTLREIAEKPYPDWICAPCGWKYGNRDCDISTWHPDTCGVCGEKCSVTEPRDFGHLRRTWRAELLAASQEQRRDK